ncbi:hypothetical protein OPV22_027817 [Ensete ventricosum]|uniref:Uncharacterized protein n=1 Tax=Ensete ventricosum TaxID=4639 RepID=A0AAV8Q0Y4_ENSVE|nr:hypothetical protein OPV22_027817 [Ensete ventricosum]
MTEAFKVKDHKGESYRKHYPPALEDRQRRLRQILGQGMSDRKWEATINHAKTCVVGDKLYVHRGRRYALLLNSVCQVVSIIAGADRYALQDLVNRLEKHTKIGGNLEEFHGLLPHTNLPLHQTNVQTPRGTVEPDLYTDQDEVGTFVYDFGDYGVGPFSYSDVQSTTY